MSTRAITVEGIQLDVAYEYHEATGDGFHEPHEPAFYEIESVMVRGTDISPLLDESMMQTIHDKLSEVSAYDD